MKENFPEESVSSLTINKIAKLRMVRSVRDKNLYDVHNLIPKSKEYMAFLHTEILMGCSKMANSICGTVSRILYRVVKK